MGNLIVDQTTRTIIIDDCGDVTIIETPAQNTIELDESSSLVAEQIETTIVLESTDREIIEVCQQGPQGQTGGVGPPGTGVLQVNSSNIMVGDTGLVDAISSTVYRSVKWLITIFDETNNKYSYSEVGAMHNNTLPFHWRAGKIGDSINIKVDVLLDGGNLRLEVTNNHTDVITVSSVRVATFN